jgi:hypothetical protein
MLKRQDGKSRASCQKTPCLARYFLTARLLRIIGCDDPHRIVPSCQAAHGAARFPDANVRQARTKTPTATPRGVAVAVCKSATMLVLRRLVDRDAKKMIIGVSVVTGWDSNRQGSAIAARNGFHFTRSPTPSAEWCRGCRVPCPRPCVGMRRCQGALEASRIEIESGSCPRKAVGMAPGDLGR